MGQVNATLETTLSVRDAADVFQGIANRARGLRSKFAERSARNRGNDEFHGFFTPSNNSAFASLDEDQPDFTVGVGLAKGNVVSGAGGGDADIIHLYVWDRGDYRELELYSPYRALRRGRSVKLVQKFINGYQQVDQQLQVTQGPA